MLLTISWFEFAMLLLRGWNWDLCFVSNDFSIFRYAQFEGSWSLFICAGTARHWTVFGLICSVREYLEDWRETRRKFYVESVWENLCSRQHKFSLTLFNWLFSFQRLNFYSNHAIKKLSYKLVATKQNSDELCNKIDSIEPMKHNYRNKNVSQLGTTFLGAVTLTFFSLLITLFIKSWK